MKPRHNLCLSSLVVLSLAQTVSAQSTLYWDTSTTAGHQGGNGTWNTSGANFWGDAVGTAALVSWTNGASNDAVFDAATASNITMGASFTAGTLFFNNSNFTITQNTGTSHGLTFNFLESNAASSTQTVNLYIPASRSMNLGGTIRDGSTGGKIALSLNAPTTGNGRILRLQGTNEYSGGTTLINGVIEVTTDANLGHSSGGVSIGGNNTSALVIADGFSTSRALTLTGSSNTEIRVAAGGTATWSGTIDYSSAGGTLGFGHSEVASGGGSERRRGHHSGPGGKIPELFGIGLHLAPQFTDNILA